MSNNQQGQTPRQREQVFCHECRVDWYRDEHGLVCPRCGGDFVEIVEERDDPHLNAGMPDLIMPSDDEDEDDADLAAMGFMPHTGIRVFPGPIGVGVRPGGGHDTPGTPGGHGPNPPPLSELLSALFGLVGRGAGGPAGDAARVGTPGAGQGDGQYDGSQPRTEGMRTYGPVFRTERRFEFRGGGGTHISTRFTYDSDAHMPGGPIPFTHGERPPNRRADSDQRVEDLPAMLTRMFGPMGGAGNNDPMIDIIQRLMGGFNPSGDYVFSENDFDRLITELMEQHQGNAPPPAPKEVLDNLPKIKVTQEMVVNNEDCAVCKEDLVLDEELVALPCKHHYHEVCVRKWLESHDTCPICRRPTSDHGPYSNNTNNNPTQANTSAGSGTDNSRPSGTRHNSNTQDPAPAVPPTQQEQSIPGAWPSWLTGNRGSADRGGS